MKYITAYLLFFLLSFLCRAQDRNFLLPEVHVEITMVKKGANDTLWLTLKGGSNIGIAKGMDGSAVQVYRGKEREYTVLSKAVLTRVNEKEAVAYVINKEQKEAYLIQGDQVMFSTLPIKVAKTNANHVLLQLAAYNIQFADQSALPFYSQTDVLKNGGSTKMDSLLAVFQRDVIETGSSLKEVEDKPKDWMEPLTVSRFAGTGLLDALQRTSLLDIESFLQFVLEYPGKYIGRKWKFNETYATWVINDMPPATYKNYLVSSIAKTPDSQMDKWIQENKFYYDSTKQYINATIDTYIADKKTDSAEWLLTKATLLSEAAKDAGFLSNIYTSRGQLAQVVVGKDHQAVAIRHYQKAIELDSLNWAPYWYRAHLYGDMEQYDQAIKDAKLLVRRYPDWGSAWGSQGWWYMKQFKIKEAGISCLKAYELDTASSAWAVNLAHYYLLTGQNEKARSFYQKTLDNLKTESDFINGPLADFAFFEERGVLSFAFAREKIWMQEKYDANYKHHLRADSLFKLAKEMFAKKEWNLAAINFKKSREAEKSALNKRFRTIHNITTWIGFMHSKMNDYVQSELYYTEALHMAKKDFPDQLQNDLELMGELYNKWGKKALADAYEAKAFALKDRKAESAATTDLHVVSIGVDDYNDLKFQWAAADAKKIADAFVSKGKRFAKVHAHTLTNKQAISDSVDITMQRIIGNAKEDDTFVFYFTGKAVNNEKESFLIPYGLQNESDSLLRKKAISAQLLKSWSNSIPSKHQFFLLDAPSAHFTSAFADHSSSLSKTVLQKDVIMIGAGFPRIEEREKSSSIVASAFLSLFSDSSFSTEKIITGKKIETLFADEITRSNYFLSLESYSQGRDFVLAETNPQQIQSRSAPATNIAITNLRGGGVENVSQSAGYTLNKRYGLFIATDVYADPKWSRLYNPISDATDLQKALEEEYGFEIELMSNPTKSQIFNKIDEYSRKKFDKNDQLVILFAGHGYYDSRRKEGYLVPSDASYTNTEFDRYYYPMSSIMRDLKIIPANHIMVLVDACHGGAICDNALMRGEGEMYGNLSMDELLKNHLSFPNRVILTSGRKDQRVPDGIKGKNSPFMAAILSALRSREAREKGIVSYYQLMKHISDVQKTQATSALFSSNDNWDFMFFYGGNKKKSPIADPTGGASKSP